MQKINNKKTIKAKVISE